MKHEMIIVATAIAAGAAAWALDVPLEGVTHVVEQKAVVATNTVPVPVLRLISMNVTFPRTVTLPDGSESVRPARVAMQYQRIGPDGEVLSAGIVHLEAAELDALLAGQGTSVDEFVGMIAAAAKHMTEATP